METAVAAEEPRNELFSRIGQLAGRLNRSESVYLDALIDATRHWDPQPAELATLTAQKLADAQELLILLDQARQK